MMLSVFTYAQTFYTIEVVAEGNMGTPNADVFRVTNETGEVTTTPGLFQQANTTSGFDVLQDYDVFGSKAIFGEKPAGEGRITVVDYPSFEEVHTFSTSGVQTLVMASETKAYASTMNGFLFVDIANTNTSSIIDTENILGTSSTNHMLYAKGVVYIGRSDKLIMVDTTNQTVLGAIEPNIGSIAGIAFDENAGLLWVMNGAGKLASIDVNNNHQVSPEVITGVNGTSLLREYNGNLYFWNLSSKSLYIYEPAISELPLSSVYVSNIAGGSWSVGYGRSFAIDPNSGDFVICSADAFVAPSKFEVVNGTDFTVIGSGEMEGVAIANKCYLTTYEISITPDLDELENIHVQCYIKLTAPTANEGEITATTADATIYDTPGTYTVTWTYQDSYGNTLTQEQLIVVADTIAPIPNYEVLTDLLIACNEPLTNFPLAQDNCDGEIVGTTDNLTFEEEGTYEITWRYTDATGNETEQTQIIEVVCESTSLSKEDLITLSIYPNPATNRLTIDAENNSGNISIYNAKGALVTQFEMNENTISIAVDSFSKGVYYLHFTTETNTKIEKVVIH